MRTSATGCSPRSGRPRSWWRISQRTSMGSILKLVSRALGREVFWTCRQDHIACTHFDTNHYQHITWVTYAELREKLAEKIMAVVGVGRGRRSPVANPGPL